MAGLGFYKLSQRKNSKIVGDLLGLFGLLKFMPIYMF
jgi:hypothetical protein